MQASENNKFMKRTAWTVIFLHAFTPLSASAAAVKGMVASTSINEQGRVSYIVQSGDTAWQIAERYGVTPKTLQTLNPGLSTDALSKLKVGQQIYVPRGKDMALPSLAGAEQQKHEAIPKQDYTLAKNLSQLGNLAGTRGADARNNQLAGMAAGVANSQVEQWFSQFGTARVELGLNKDLSLEGSAVDVLVPIYDSPDSMLFTQLGYRNKDSRNMINIGAGVRVFQGDWMYGANAFWDNDLTGKNRRVGIGAEAWRDYLKLSGNTYFGLTDWHQSRDFADYDERPADGWDIRAEGWLPAYPQLGGKLMYEKYRGNDVALFDKNNRAKNPHAVTTGVTWTPFPLMTAGVDRRSGSSGNNDTRVNLQFSVRPDMTLRQHFDSSAVGATRQLSSSRYGLVERNNNIVLDYRRQEVILLTLPQALSGTTLQPLTVTPQIKTKYGLSHIDWQAPELLSNGGTMASPTPQQLQLQLPRVAGTYVLSGVASDTKGNLSARVSTFITVTGEDVIDQSNINLNNLAVTPATLPADGTSTASMTFTLTDQDGQPVTGQSSHLSATIVTTPAPQPALFRIFSRIASVLSSSEATISEFRESAPGEYHATMTAGTIEGTTTTTIHWRQNPIATTSHEQIPEDVRLKAGSISVVSDNAMANGRSENIVQVVVETANGVPRAGVMVSWQSDKGEIVADSMTDSSGTATATIASLHPGVHQITALLGADRQQTNVNFIIADAVEIDGLGIAVTKNNARANGLDTNTVALTLVDMDGNALPYESITLSASNGAQIASSVTTDRDGEASALVTSLTTGSSEIGATYNGTTVSVTMMFTDDPSSATIAEKDLTVTKDNAIANGTDSNRIQVRVTDIAGNPLAGQVVMLNTSEGATALGSVTTGNDGTADATVTSTVPGSATLWAQIGGTQRSVTMTFIPSTDTAIIAEGDFYVSLNGALADGIEKNEVGIRVTDAYGNPLAGERVNLAASNGATIIDSVTTAADGRATAPLTSQTVGKSTVTATLHGSSRTVNVRFVEKDGDAEVSDTSLKMEKDNAKADGVDQNVVSISITDAEGHAMAGQNVLLTASNGAVIAEEVTTGPQGTARATLTSKTAGQSVIRASINGYHGTITATFNSDAATATIPVNGLSRVRDGAVANGVDTNIIQLRVTDAVGNPVANQEITLSATNNAVLPAIATTDAGGQATVPFTSLSVGNTIVSASLNGVTRSITMLFVADDNTAVIVDGDFMIVRNDAKANGLDSNAIRVKVTDENGNPLPYQRVSLSADHTVNIRDNIITGIDGTAEAILTSLVAGSKTVTARIGSSSHSLTLNFISDAHSATILPGGLRVERNNAVADGTSMNSVIATVTDKDGNAVAGQTVYFAVTGEANIAQQAISGNDGSAEVFITSLKARDEVVTASINSINRTVKITFVANDNNATLLDGSMLVLNDLAFADGVATNRVQVGVTDQNGNPIEGQKVSFSATAGAAISDSPLTDKNGLTTVNISNTTVGISTITAFINGTSLSADVMFRGNTSTARIADGDLSIVKDDALANGVDTNLVEVKATDGKGNILPYQVVTLSASNGAMISGSLITGLDGTARTIVSSLKAGAATISASLNSSHQDVEVNFKADASDIIVRKLEVITDNVIADGIAEAVLRLTVTDLNRNPVANQDVAITAPVGVTVPASVVTDAEGTATVTATSIKAGLQRITAATNGTSQQANVTFTANTATATIADGDLSIALNDALADGVDTNAVTLRVTDGNGNPLAGQTVSLKADNQATIANTATTADDGRATVTLTSATAGKSTVTATLGVVSRMVTVTFAANQTSATIASGNLSIKRNGAKADGVDANEINILVTDATDNPVANQYVTLTASNGAVIADSVQTGSDGKATVTLTSRVAGNSVIRASLNGQHSTVTVSFISDADTATITQNAMVVMRDRAVANGIDSNEVQITVTDAQGSPVAAQEIILTASNNANIAPSATTDTDGRASVTLTSHSVGDSLVSATVNGTTRYATVTFRGDSTTATIAAGDLDVTVNGAKANGLDTNQVEVKVTDASGNPLPFQSVTLSANNDALINSTMTTGADGKGRTIISSLKAGTSRVTAAINGNSLSADVSFIADAASARISALEVINDGQVADNVATAEVRVTVTDINNNPFSGQVVNLSAPMGVGVPTSVTTAGDGTATLTMTSTVAGLQRLSAAANGSYQQVDVRFIANAATATIASNDLRVASNGALADGADTNAVQVRVTDYYGNVLAGQTVTLNADNSAAMTNSSVTTATDGTAIASLTNTTAGDTTVTATLGSTSRTVQVKFIASAGSATIADGDLNLPRNGAKADGNDQNEISVKVTDSGGNPVANQYVTLTATNGAEIVSGVQTDSNGSATATFTSRVAGNSTIYASVNGKRSSIVALFISDSSTATLTENALSIVKNNALANGSDDNQVRVLVTDQAGNPVSGQTVTLMANHQAIVAPTVTSGSDGTALIPVTSRLAGDSLLTATVGSTSRAVTLRFTSDYGSATIAEGDLEVMVDGVEANGLATNRIRVKVTDAAGNSLPYQSVSLSADNSALISSTLTTGSDGTGQAIVSSLKAGTSVVTASINGTSRSVNLVFTADASAVTISKLEVITDNVVANGLAEAVLQATVTDINGNLVSGQAITLAASSGVALPATVTTLEDGTAQIVATSQNVGSQRISATVGSRRQSVDVMFIADTATARIAAGDLWVAYNGALADGIDTNGVGLRVTDSNGNILAGQTVTLSATQGAVLAGSVTTDAKGEANALLTNDKAGSNTVTATLGSSTQNVNVLFVANSGSATILDGDLRVEHDQAIANGVATNGISVKVTDAYGNPVNNKYVTLTASNGAVIIDGVRTGTDGTATATLTSRVAGESRIRASANGHHATVIATFRSDAATATLADNALTLVKNGALANRTDSNQVRVAVTDANGNPVAGQSIALSADNQAQVVSSAVSEADGSVVVDITSGIAGRSSLTATVNGTSRSITLDFSGDSATARIAAGDLDAVIDGARANGLDTNRIRVRVTDANGNALPYQTVTLSAGNGALVNSTLTTGVDGSGQAILSNLKAGVSVVTAAINGSSQSLDMHFSADATSATVSQLEVVTEDVLANNLANAVLRVTVVDINGNLLSGQSVTIATPTGVKAPATVTTSSDGTATFNVTSVKAGAQRLSAAINSSRQYADVNFIADAATATIVLNDLTIVKDNAIADGVDNAHVRARVTDANGNTLSGYTVAFSANNGAIVPVSAVTGSDGTVTIAVTNTTSGNSTVNATVNGTTRQVTVKFGSGIADASKSTMTLDTSSIEADGVAQAIATVILRDASGNLVTGANVDIYEVTGVVPSAELIISKQQENNGTYTAVVKGTYAGQVILAVTSNGLRLAGVQQSLALISNIDAAHSTMTLSKNTLTANDSDTTVITLTLRDKRNQVVELQARENVTLRMEDLAGGATVSSHATLSALSFNGTSYTGTLRGKAGGELKLTPVVTRSFSAQPTVYDAQAQDVKLTTAISPTLSTLMLDSAEGLSVTGVNGLLPTTTPAILTLRDYANNPIGGSRDRIRYLLSDADIISGATVTPTEIATGVYATQLTAARKSGSVMVIPTIDGKNIGLPVTNVMVHSGPISLTQSVITNGGGNTSVFTRRGETWDYTYELRDDHGNAVTGLQQVSSGLTNSTGSQTGSSLTATTNVAAGTLSMRLVVSNNVAGTEGATFKPYVDYKNANFAQQRVNFPITLTLTLPSVNLLTVVDGAIAGSGNNNQVLLTLSDKRGVMANTPVRRRIDGVQASTADSTNSQGQLTISWSRARAGRTTLNIATIDGQILAVEPSVDLFFQANTTSGNYTSNYPVADRNGIHEWNLPYANIDYYVVTLRNNHWAPHIMLPEPGAAYKGVKFRVIHNATSVTQLFLSGGTNAAGTTGNGTPISITAGADYTYMWNGSAWLRQ